ncbi:MAG: hypothetical protein ACYCS7_11380 [Acidimicrobiales bacterium]
MITPGDEYPLHQSSRPVRDPGTDRNAYDRFFFNGYSPDGAVYFAAALGLYPGRNIMDAGFSVMADGVQHNVHASRLLGPDRLDTSVGPIRVRIIEPLRRLAVDVDYTGDGPGIQAHLEFAYRSPIFEEPHYLWKVSHRSIFDITRMTQNGTWAGHIEIGSTRIEVDNRSYLGTRDRSWGTRPVGEREAPGAPEADASFYWLWAPLNFDDASVLFDVNENADGTRWHHSAAWAPVGDLDAPIEEGRAGYVMTYRPGTRHARSFDLDFDLGRHHEVVHLEPVANFYMQGIGYTHPTWGHGMYVGDEASGYDAIVTAEADETNPFYQHVQTLCRAEREHGRPGMGLLEQLIIGPHQPSGLSGLLDMHP